MREEPSQFERAAPLAEAVGDNGSLGWPEHWANGGEIAGEVQTRPQHHAPVQAVDPAPQDQHSPARRPTFFERLAGLVGTKNAG